MSKYQITHRFNKHGKHPHCFDITDDTGHCVHSCSSLYAETAKAEARAWVKEREASE